jgi:glucose/arabinose dehydrogenase
MMRMKAFNQLAPLLALAAMLAPSSGFAQTFKSSAGDLTVETVAQGLVHPWALAFLPDGRMLVTERPGRIRIVARDGKLSPPLANVPRVFAVSQGGLLDLSLDRNFAQNKTLYFSYAEPFGNGGRTALARATLDSETPKLDDVKVIYRQEGPSSSGNHFGGRIAQSSDGNLFVTNGEHFTDRDKAQTLDNDLGKIVRITPDGAAPKDNPFVGKAGARPEVWSFGHRNPQGLTINPADGTLWEQEHGAMGGDEINIIAPGKNYGWPLASYAVNYNGVPIPSPDTRPDLAKPVLYWTPVIDVGNLIFYNGKMFPQWKGSAFVSGLGTKTLNRIVVSGATAKGAERWAVGKRIRDVEVAPDGALWMLEDSALGGLFRVTPK